jgi:hypothetical protein
LICVGPRREGIDREGVMNSVVVVKLKLKIKKNNNKK